MKGTRVTIEDENEITIIEFENKRSVYIQNDGLLVEMTGIGNAKITVHKDSELSLAEILDDGGGDLCGDKD